MKELKEISELYERLTEKEKQFFIRLYDSVNSDKVKKNKIIVISQLRRTIEGNIEKGIQTDIDRTLKLNKLNILK